MVNTNTDIGNTKNIFLSLLSNFLLSLYQPFNKYINFNDFSKNLYRSLIVLLTSFTTSQKIEISKMHIITSVLNLLHIAFSTYGFRLLSEFGSVVFYLWPLFFYLIQTTSTITFNIFKFSILLIPFICILLLNSKLIKLIFFNSTFMLGTLLMLCASLCETLITYIHKNYSTENNTNDLFNFYLTSTIILILLIPFFKLEFSSSLNHLIILILGNIILGFTGYLLRLMTLNNLSTFKYSLLSFSEYYFEYIRNLI
jgi:hypothetical protein